MTATRQITSFVSVWLPYCVRSRLMFCHPDRPELFVNAPVGLQLVGRCQEEEAVIAMTEIVDAALKQAKSSVSKL